MTVIALAQWPKGLDRQTIRFRDPSGHVQQYSLSSDDPRLLLVAEQLRRWKDGGFSGAIALAKWRHELAGFYAENVTDVEIKPTQAVVPVSFEQVVPAAKALTPDTASYWMMAQRRAEQELRHAEQQLARRLDSSGPQPLELGELVPPAVGTAPLAISALAGIIVACGFVFWSYLCPAIRLQDRMSMVASDQPETEDPPATSPLQLEIPADWVRVHQPLGVHLRRLGYAAIVTTALVNVVV